MNSLKLKSVKLSPPLILYGSGILLFLITFLIWNLLKNYLKYGKAKNLPKDVALIYGSPCGKTVPSPSPYVLKLETYMRMAKIPYQIDTNFTRSKQGKVPWMIYNGLEIADSQACIEYFNKKLSIDFDQHLNEREKAIAYSFRVMAEKNMIWHLIMIRYIYGGLNQFYNLIYVKPWQRGLLTVRWLFFRFKLLKRTRADGIGYRNQNQVYELACKDLDAISTFLGNKSYLMGEQFSEVDTSIFGFLAQMLWTYPEYHPLRLKFHDDWTNLEAYCVRMKKQFWPDWESRLKPGYNLTYRN